MSEESAMTMRELGARESGGLIVRLLWSSADGLVVTVADAQSGEAFAVHVRAGDDPLDVFRHPFPYAARRGIDTRPSRAVLV